MITKLGIQKLFIDKSSRLNFSYFFKLHYQLIILSPYFSLYDEDGYGAVKRVLERGEDIETVKPMATVVVNYPVTISYLHIS